MHAEANAIIHARQNCHDFSLYTTLFPCGECAKLIIQSGIKEVYYVSDKHHHGEKEVIAAQRMLKDAGIKCVSIPALKIVVKR